ncbi:MAG: hypothetical protein HY211_03135 [Candidatus Omnitrophica bacterium]|nr:hypothetical protein [Candidatus Omnitrophota bacterium]
MIRINLLPPIGRRAIPQFGQMPWKLIGRRTLTVVVSISCLLLLANGLHAWTLGRLTAQWNRIQPEWNRLQRTQGVLRALQNRTTLQKTLKASEAQWAPRLNLLSNALVSQLWFSSLEFKTTVAHPNPTAPVQKPKPGAPKGAASKNPPPPPAVPMLILKGSAFVTETGAGSPVSRYLQRLKEQPDFKRMFRTVELKSVEQRQVHEEQVSDFEMLFFPEGL